MKKAETVLNFNKDTVSMFGYEQPLLFTTSGHYSVPICMSRLDVECEKINNVENISLIAVGNDEEFGKEKVVLKLHRQFCHCTPDKLKTLIRNSEIWKGDSSMDILVDKVSQQCRICKLFKKAPPRPVVGLPNASDFNKTVVMDLISYSRGTWIFHLIDMFSRYSAACVVRSKRKEVIADAIFKVWLSYFGHPNKFLADNGGEFSNNVYTDLCEQFNIQMAKTAAESLWSNGLCERHNGVIKESVNKVIEDASCSLETVLFWSISAKNTFCEHNGFSPSQLVFGRNPNHPSVLTNELPALEENASTLTVANNLKAMQKAREAFIKSEASEKIK